MAAKDPRDRADKELRDEIIKLCGDSGALDALIDLVERGLDAVTKDETVKDIPVIGTIVRLARTGIGIRDFLFLKKLSKFLQDLQAVSDEKREAYISKLQTSERERLKVGEHLLLLLDRFENMEKPSYLARAFLAYLSGEISLDEFVRLSFVIDRCFISDLRIITNIEPEVELPPHVSTILAACGVLELTAVPTIKGPHHREQIETEALENSRSGSRYELTALGYLARRVLLTD